MGMKRKVHVFIVSDATGVTAERVITAVLVQFNQVEPVFKRFPFMQSMDRADGILDEAEKLNAIIIYSLVTKELRRYFRIESRIKRIYSFDLLGPLLRRMERLWNIIPTLRPGLLEGASEESIRLAESIDYTLKHDDGLGIETIEDADLIIMGISRTSKTPTSLYLSCNNSLKVANIPIVPFVQPLQEIVKVKKRKIGFTISPEKVAIIRKKRLIYTGESEYTDIRSIKKEMLFSHKIFRQIKGLQVIDVTNRSIEEIAEMILSKY